MTDRRPRLLVLTPSADMYGSDRSLLNALPELVDRFEVTLVSAAEGPTLAHAEKLGIETKVIADFALRRRYLSPLGVFRWLWETVRAMIALVRLHRRSHFDLVYVNTLAVSVLPLARLLLRRPTVVHVREGPRSPEWLPKVLVRLVRWSAGLVICNSAYTRSFVTGYEPALADRCVVIHNGMDLPVPDA
ncbi:MAG: glycosyltransferase, partial [Actinomycetota bacterium]